MFHPQSLHLKRKAEGIETPSTHQVLLFLRRGQEYKRGSCYLFLIIELANENDEKLLLHLMLRVVIFIVPFLNWLFSVYQVAPGTHTPLSWQCGHITLPMI